MLRQYKDMLLLFGRYWFNKTLCLGVLQRTNLIKYNKLKQCQQLV